MACVIVIMLGAWRPGLYGGVSGVFLQAVFVIVLVAFLRLVFVLVLVVFLRLVFMVVIMLFLDRKSVV